eukprot:Lankesteria_metandrocarpae@DN4816_c0_g1_i1.p1
MDTCEQFMHRDSCGNNKYNIAKDAGGTHNHITTTDPTCSWIQNINDCSLNGKQKEGRPSRVIQYSNNETRDVVTFHENHNAVDQDQFYTNHYNTNFIIDDNHDHQFGFIVHPELQSSVPPPRTSMAKTSSSYLENCIAVRNELGDAHPCYHAQGVLLHNQRGPEGSHHAATCAPHTTHTSSTINTGTHSYFHCARLLNNSFSCISSFYNNTSGRGAYAGSIGGTNTIKHKQQQEAMLPSPQRQLLTSTDERILLPTAKKQLGSEKSSYVSLRYFLTRPLMRSKCSFNKSTAYSSTRNATCDTTNYAARAANRDKLKQRAYAGDHQSEQASQSRTSLDESSGDECTISDTGMSDGRRNGSIRSAVIAHPTPCSLNITNIVPAAIHDTSRVFVEHFIPLKVIGRGSFGKVFQVRSKIDGAIYAMKVLSKDYIIRRGQLQHTKAERRILGAVNHPFIVKLFYAFTSATKLYFVMEYCPGGELFYHLSREERFNESRTRFYAAQIVLALGHIHDLNVIYRDLKPENVLLDSDGYIRLTDFGLSKEGIRDSRSARSLCGTPEYLAPEILLKTGHGKVVDWWSLGSLLYEMNTGVPPFYTKNRVELFHNIRTSELKLPSSMSAELKSLLRGLLHRDPDQRLGGNYGGADEVKRHPFFASVDWAALLAKKLKPSFQPQLISEIDSQYFDDEFVCLPLRMSEIYPMDSRTELDCNLFPNFSFDRTKDRD